MSTPEWQALSDAAPPDDEQTAREIAFMETLNATEQTLIAQGLLDLWELMAAEGGDE